MKKTITILVAAFVLLTIYWRQHVKPVDDPQDTPLFQERLKSSLDRFQENEFPGREEDLQQRAMTGQRISPSPRTAMSKKDLIAVGRCGSISLTWVEEKKIEKETISIKRRTQGEEYSLTKGSRTYERAEEGGGIRYWVSDSGLTDGLTYEYLISFKDAAGKELTRGPVSTTLTCNEKDREMLAQREKKLKEYYKKKGVDVKEYASKRSSPSPSPRPPVSVKDLVVAGRCGNVSLTWVEEKMIEKETITIRRKTPGEEYSPLKKKRIYERAEEGGIRYWTSDSGLTDGLRYEYLVSFKDALGKEAARGPASISLTCNERDREIVAQREKMIKEYYQKRGITKKEYGVPQPPSYQLSDEVFTIDPGNSPWKGRKDAPVTLVVFTDFECLYCSTWAETLETILKTYPEKVRIVFKHFPISYHTNSELAAMAALAAGAQGKFWEMHDLLFKNYNALRRENLIQHAKTLGLNRAQFQKSLESAEFKKMINQDKSQGKTLGVQNSPTTFINGRRLVGSPPVSYVKKVIEEILKKE